MQLDTLRIVGNGPGKTVEPVANQLTITFNPTIGSRPMWGEIQISNWKHAGLRTACRPFVVAAPTLGSAWCQQFEDQLRHSAKALEPLLGCFPSSGLAAVHAALLLAKHVSVCRMPLMPSFVRAADMPPRKPLPGAFHNWLGERRLGLSLLREYGPERLIWKSLSLVTVMDIGERTDSNPLIMLTDLLSQGKSIQESEFAETLEQLAGFEQRAWIHNTDQTWLMDLERHFFLSRHSSNTPNWWLYSNRISLPLDNILHRLMLCQLELAGKLRDE